MWRRLAHRGQVDAKEASIVIYITNCCKRLDRVIFIQDPLICKETTIEHIYQEYFIHGKKKSEETKTTENEVQHAAQFQSAKTVKANDHNLTTV